jgi:hypothetical protein
MAAGEEEPQAVVLDARGLGRVGGRLGVRLGRRDLGEVAASGRGVAPPLEVREPAPRDGRQPRRRTLGDSVDRPALEGARDRVLQRVLGEVEVTARRPNQSCEDDAPLLPEDLLEHAGRRLGPSA